MVCYVLWKAQRIVVSSWGFFDTEIFRYHFALYVDNCETIPEFCFRIDAIDSLHTFEYYLAFMACLKRRRRTTSRHLGCHAFWKSIWIKDSNRCLYCTCRKDDGTGCASDMPPHTNLPDLHRDLNTFLLLLLIGDFSSPSPFLFFSRFC